LPLKLIRIDGDTRPRVEVLEQTVDEYRRDMLKGHKFPAIKVVFDGHWYWLFDGFHRYLAARRARLEKIKARVYKGPRQKAVWWSLSVNQFHGLRRSNDDKAYLIDRAIKLRPDRSNRFIAKHLGVSDKTVIRRRGELESTAEIPQLKRLRGLDGRWRPARFAQTGIRRMREEFLQALRKESGWRREGAGYQRWDGRYVPAKRELPFNDLAGHRFSEPGRQRMEEVFDRRWEIDRMIHMALRLQDRAVMSFDRESPLYIGFDLPGFDARMDAVIGQLRSSCPYSICLHCQGSGCEACGGRGWLPQERPDPELPALPAPVMAPVEVA
jgi:hypothetical protein